jgi:hypothetical protein
MNPRPLLALPVLLLALAACGSGATPSASPAGVTATDVASTPTPTLEVPSASVAVPTSSPGATAAPMDPAEPEAALLHGARLDLQGKCAALRTGLPEDAMGAVECLPASDVAARASMIMFDTQAQLLDAYWARVEAEGIEPHTDGSPCEPGAACEGGYVPGDGHPGLEPAERGASWTDAAGTAHYVATLPPFILLQVDGRAGSTMSGVGRFAWLGNRDQPGNPTLWAEEPLSPEK